jgi:hypothetical protein
VCGNERRYEVDMKVGKSITWGEIVEIAEQQDRKIKKAALISNTEDERRMHLEKTKCQVSDDGISGRKAVRSYMDPRVYRNSQIPHQTTDNIPNYNDYNNRGHTGKYCWRKKVGYTNCGSTVHLLEECPKYVADFRGKSLPCFRCAREHLMEDCTFPMAEMECNWMFLLWNHLMIYFVLLVFSQSLKGLSWCDSGRQNGCADYRSCGRVFD